MQSTATSTSTHTDILNTMQPQPAQNMYVNKSANTNAANARTNQQTGGLFHGPPTNSGPPRSARHVQISAMYPPHLPPNVVMSQFAAQYSQRQTYPQFSPYGQPLQSHYYTYPYAIPPPTYQRAGVAGVGTAMSVQTGPNGPMAIPAGATQTQMNIGSGAILTSTVPSAPGAVMAVAPPSSGQVVVPSTTVTTQPPSRNKTKRRPFAIDIIDPCTKKNVLEDYGGTNNASQFDNDCQEQISSTSSTIQSEVSLGASHQDHPMIGNSAIVVSAETQSYNLDIQEMPQRETAVGQTPIVSAMSDAPSVEILPTPQKPRNKKPILIINPKEDQNTGQNTMKNLDDSNKNQLPKPIDDTVSDCVQQQSQQYESIKVPHTSEETIAPQIATENNLVDATGNVLNNIINPGEQIFALGTIDNFTLNDTTADDNNSLPNEVIIASNLTIVHQENTELIGENINEIDPSDQYVQTMPMIIQNETNVGNNKINEPISSTATNYLNGVPTDASIATEEDKKNNLSTVINNNNNYDVKKNIDTKQITINEPELIQEAFSECDETDRAPSLPRQNSENDLEMKTENQKTLIKNEPSSIPPESSDIQSTMPLNFEGISSIPQDKMQQIINYNEGQWSPQNPTGKKQYDRDQLLQLRGAKASRIQPEVNNVSILPQSNLMPSFVRNNTKRVQSLVGSIGGNRGGDGVNNNFVSKQVSMSGVSGRGSMKGMIHVNLSLHQDVKLNETDNAWRPRALVKGSESDIDPQVIKGREKEQLVRRVRGILNKLTPEKFDVLVEEIIKLKIDTEDKMEDVMVLVFEKAIDEPNFSVSYAQLCLRLINEAKARDDRMETGTKTNLAHFRSALLDKTEREFTINVTQTKTKEKKLEPIIERIKFCTDLTEKAELEAQLEEEERKIRRRSGGTVRFIGELFKISMLTGKIINHCIDSLLNPKSEDMLECLCKLLTTVGAKFEKTPYNSKEPKGTYSLDKVMARMQGIASKSDKESAKISSRVRFMLQDVIDLRKNKWQSTKNEAPKTMEQIEKEAKTEQLSSQFLNYSGPGSSTSGTATSGSQIVSGKRDDRNNRFGESRSSMGYSGSHSQRGDTGSLRRQQQNSSNNINNNTNNAHSNGGSEDTWHVQTGKRSVALDSNKLEGLQTIDIGTKKMGGASQFQWNNMGSRQSSTATSVLSNSFAALSTLTDGSDRGRNDRGGPRNKGGLYSKNSMERDRYGDRGVHTRTGSSQASRENSSSRGSQSNRGMMHPSSMQKTASHSKYSQVPSRGSAKSSGLSSVSSETPTHHRSEQHNSVALTSQQYPSSINDLPNRAPAAVFEELSNANLTIVKSIISEMVETAVSLKAVDSSVIACFKKLKEDQRCGLIYYILTDYLHLGKVGQIQRLYLANIIVYLINTNFLSVDHFKLAYKRFEDLAADLIVDIPDLWLYICEFTGPLIAKNIIAVHDLWTKSIQEQNIENFGHKFLKTFLLYCTREIGLSFTRNMWKTSNMKWIDFIPDNEVQNFIRSNKLEYVENEQKQIEIDSKETQERRMNRIVDHIDFLLYSQTNADDIIDYINGNIIDIDKQFIRQLTKTLCNFSIIMKQTNKLDLVSFKNICIPVLQRYLDSKEELELECLYSMQLLVHSLEHPRGLLSELFNALYECDVVSQESFIKWRDSNDQSAGKGVAVKGLNPFFTLVLTETSD